MRGLMTLRRNDGMVNWPHLVDEMFADMDRMFSNTPATQAVFLPPTDVYEKDDAYHIDMDIPGLSKDEVHIEAHEGILSVRGERKAEQTQEQSGWYRRERYVGSFQRSWRLPENAESDGVTARIADGVLRMRLPKRAEVQPKKIEVSIE